MLGIKSVQRGEGGPQRGTYKEAPLSGAGPALAQLRDCCPLSVVSWASHTPPPRPGSALKSWQCSGLIIAALLKPTSLTRL